MKTKIVSGLVTASAASLICMMTLSLPAHGQNLHQAAPAQTSGSGTAVFDPYAVRMFHPTPPLPAYEVATIKKADPNGSGVGTARSVGDGSRAGRAFNSSQTVKDYILRAYGASSRSQAQVVGGPAWISTDSFVIQGKASEELHDAMQKMTPAERDNQESMMQQSLLADRLKLKAHFETRQLPVFELAAAKGGLKIHEVPPPPSDPAAPPPPGAGPHDLPFNMVFRYSRPGGISVYSLRSATMSSVVDLLRASPEVGGVPVLDKTGFTGHFDIIDLQWRPSLTANSETSGGEDAPSLFTALGERFGLKVSETRGPVEVLVIDSIERPSEN